MHSLKDMTARVYLLILVHSSKCKGFVQTLAKERKKTSSPSNQHVSFYCIRQKRVKNPGIHRFRVLKKSYSESRKIASLAHGQNRRYFF